MQRTRRPAASSTGSRDAGCLLLIERTLISFGGMKCQCASRLNQMNRRFSIDITEWRLAEWERAGEHLYLRQMRCVL